MSLSPHYYTPDAFSIPALMSPEECQTLIVDGERAGFDTASISTTEGHINDLNIRNNARLIFDNADLAAAIWQRLKGCVPPAIDAWRAKGLNERFRLYRYTKAQQFKMHTDGCFQRTMVEESKLTFMVYLNEGFSGGSTHFGHFEVLPKTGMGLCFRHHLPHEGMTVEEGTKYALRSDVMYVKEQP